METGRHTLLEVLEVHQFPTTRILGQPCRRIFSRILDPKDIHFIGHIPRVRFLDQDVHRLPTLGILMFEFIAVAMVENLDPVCGQSLASFVEISGRLVRGFDIKFALALDPGCSDIADPELLTFLGYGLGFAGDAVHREVPCDRLETGFHQHLSHNRVLEIVVSGQFHLVDAETLHRPDGLGNIAGELGSEAVELNANRSPEMGTRTYGRCVTGTTNGQQSGHQSGPSVTTKRSLHGRTRVNRIASPRRNRGMRFPDHLHTQT